MREYLASHEGSIRVMNDKSIFDVNAIAEKVSRDRERIATAAARI